MFTSPSVRFGAPEWLPLLALPASLLALWCWRLARRQRDRRRLRRVGATTAFGVNSRVSLFGDLPGWFGLLLAVGLTIVALARPLAVTSSVRTGGIDLVVLQDGSASMRVEDVAGDRWRRSMQFLRTLASSLRWEDDRIALALFARMATPQIRLTRDPNTFFFFLDHLEDAPPFRLQDPGTWDTNIERGIYWGLRLIARDEELRGPGRNARAFVLLSDGQAWSGEVATSVAAAARERIPIHAVGVGTTAGGVIPEPRRAAYDEPVSSRLDRDSLAAIAAAAGGRYFELDHEPDADIANAIIAATRRRAPQGGVAETTEELYATCLLAAAGCLLAAALSRAW